MRRSKSTRARSRCAHTQRCSLALSRHRAAKNDLGYKPIIRFDDGWRDTIEWFRTNWLPTFDTNASGYAGRIAKQTQRKIDIQAGAADDKSN